MISPNELIFKVERSQAITSANWQEVFNWLHSYKKFKADKGE